MKLIIAGSRHLDIPKEMIDWIIGQFQDLNDVNEIVSGTAKGVDTSGELFAKRYNMGLTKFPANWEEYGKKAGHLRNAEMAEYADALLLVWDGLSNGSANMKNQMLKLDKPVYEFIIKRGLSGK